MTKQRIKQLRQAVNSETMSLDELIEIQETFKLVPDEKLSDIRENALAADMLDEIERHLSEADSKRFVGLNVCPYCKGDNLETIDTRYEIDTDDNTPNRPVDKPDDLICQDYRCNNCSNDWTVEYRPVAYYKYEKHGEDDNDGFIDMPIPFEKL